MSPKHVDKQIQAYLDNRLSSTERHQIEEHLRDCPICTYKLFKAERIHQQVGPVMQAALGKPSLRPTLQHEVRHSIKQQQSGKWSWAIPIRFFNTVGTMATLALLAFGLYWLLQSQMLDTSNIANETVTQTLSPNQGEVNQTTPEPSPTATLVAAIKPTATVNRPQNSFSDTIPTPTPQLVLSQTNSSLMPVIPFDTNKKIENALSGQTTPDEDAVPLPISLPSLPVGTIAYPLYNPASQQYEINFIQADGSKPHKFDLAGVSEPALHPATNQLAFRAWQGPTSPRSILTGHLSNQQFQSVTDFWEDAHADWSPTEDRIIFTSQRESDRHWRLYTVWGDGSLEVNLRREGNSPTFAPDGNRFAYKACQEDQCGLWLSNLEYSEYESSLVLVDTMAKSPDWSPNTEIIAYMSNSNGNWDIYVVDSDGNNNRQLTNNPAIDGLPVWSPDGEWLAFVSNRADTWGIWLLHVKSGTEHHLITFEYGSLGAPDQMPYSEHGQRYWWNEQLSWGN